MPDDQVSPTMRWAEILIVKLFEVIRVMWDDHLQINQVMDELRRDSSDLKNIT